MLNEITHRLNNICRFNGAVSARGCDRIYSVLEHTTIGMRIMREAGKDMTHRVGFAIHDMAEAFVGDMISPIKTSPKIRGPFAELEEAEHLRICHALRVDPALSKSPVVKIYDNIMLAAEIYAVATITDGNHPYIHERHGRAAALIANGECNGLRAFVREWEMLAIQSTGE